MIDNIETESASFCGCAVPVAGKYGIGDDSAAWMGAIGRGTGEGVLLDEWTCRQREVVHGPTTGSGARLASVKGRAVKVVAIKIRARQWIGAIGTTGATAQNA